MLFFSIFIIFFLSIFCLIVWNCYIHCNRRGRLISKIPGPTPWPIVGNVFSLLAPNDGVWLFYRKMANLHYPVYKFWISHIPIVIIRHPDDIEILLTDTQTLDKSVSYNQLHPWLNEGLLTSSGDKWRHRRTIINRAFNFNILQDSFHSFTKHTNRLVQTLREEAVSGETIKDLLPITSSLTLNTICETSMGTSVKKIDVDQDSYRNAVYKFGETYYYRFVRPWLHGAWIFNQTKKGQEQNEARKVLHEFTSNIIKQRREYHKETNYKYLEVSSKEKFSDSEDDGNENRENRLALLDLLILAAKKDKDSIDDKGIQEEVDTFVFAGHDTINMALLFGIKLFSENQEIQSRARKEVEEIVVENGGKITINAVQKLSYLERCIKETLRLFPSVPIIGREIKQDIQLKHCLVPSGTILGVGIFDTHRDLNFWNNPDVYDPDRFLPEKCRQQHPYAYIPFSSGQKFALLELKTIFAGLLQNFYFEKTMDGNADTKMISDVILRCAGPVKIKFKSTLQNN